MKITLKKRYIAITSVLVVLIAFILIMGDSEKEKIRQTRALITIDTTELATYSYDVEMRYIGTLYAANAFDVNSKIAGRIVNMYYDIGDKVENGAAIAEIDDVQYQLEYQQAIGKLDMEKSKVQQKQMTIDLAEREFERMTALREEKVISESQLEKAQYDFERQKLTFDMDQASLANQETSVEMARLRLSYTKIEANWGEDDQGGARVLAERYVDVGEIINTNKPIASIMEIGLLRAEIFVGEKEYPHFEIGMKVTLEVDAFPEDKFVGEVERVAPFLNEQTRQAKVLVSVKNEDLKLRPGMFARTTVIFAHRDDVVMLPKQCIIEYRNQNGVYLYDEENKQVMFKRVEVGDVHENNIEILNARAIDMPVVSIGQHMVRHMMKVNHIKDVKDEEPPKRAADEKKAAPKKKAVAKTDDAEKAAERRAANQRERVADVTDKSNAPAEQTQSESAEGAAAPVEQKPENTKEASSAESESSSNKGTEG